MLVRFNMLQTIFLHQSDRNEGNNDLFHSISLTDYENDTRRTYINMNVNTISDVVFQTAVTRAEHIRAA